MQWRHSVTVVFLEASTRVRQSTSRGQISVGKLNSHFFLRILSVVWRDHSSHVLVYIFCRDLEQASKLNGCSDECLLLWIANDRLEDGVGTLDQLHYNLLN